MGILMGYVSLPEGKLHFPYQISNPQKFKGWPAWLSEKFIFQTFPLPWASQTKEEVHWNSTFSLEGILLGAGNCFQAKDLKKSKMT